MHTLPQVYGGTWVGVHYLSCKADVVSCKKNCIWLTNFVQNREGNCATFWGAVVAYFATTAADGKILQNKKATRLSGLAFTMVETRGIEPLTS